MITTGADLQEARKRLGLNSADLARALRLKGSHGQLVKKIADMERGFIPVTGPIATAVEAMLAGFMPEGFEQF